MANDDNGKREELEEVSLNDIFDGLDETESDGIELPVIPESLRHDKDGGESDLSDFTDDGEESANENEGENESDNKNENRRTGGARTAVTREEIEKEILEKLARERAQKTQVFKKAALICLAAAILIGAGLFTFIQIDRGLFAGSHIMTVNGEKISIEEFKLFMLMNSGSFDPIADALKMLEEFVVYERAAKDRNITMTPEERREVRNYINYEISQGIPLDKFKIPDSRIEDIIGQVFVIAAIWEQIEEESNFTLDAGALAEEMAAYLADGKFVRFILADEQERGESAVNAIRSGSAPLDVIAEYTIPMFAEQSLELIDLDRFLHDFMTRYMYGISYDARSGVIALDFSEVSEVINMGDFIVLIAASGEETEAWLRENGGAQAGAETETETETEEDFQARLEEFYSDNKLLKYIVVDTVEKARAARNALDAYSSASGSPPATEEIDEAIALYSDYYQEAFGIETIELSRLGLSESENARILALGENEYSEVIALGPFIVFIAATLEETEAKIIEEQKGWNTARLFDEEIGSLEEELDIKINQRALDKFDEDEFWDDMFSGW